MKMNLNQAQELIIPLRQGKANGISSEWTKRLIEALEYVIENETAQHCAQTDLPCRCAEIESAGVVNPDCPRHGAMHRTSH